jgi:acyl transferase domain-containing protein/phosphopantetheinyl transferase
MNALIVREDSPAEDIAVIGLGCLFPGAPDVATFWRNIVSKKSAITAPPPEAWDEDVFYDVASQENDRVYCKMGGYLGPLAFFDPLDHGVMPRSVEGGEPDQWLALRVARDALRDAGYPGGVPHSDRAALILGKGTYANRGTISVVYHGVVIDYTLQLLKSINPDLTDEDLARVREDLKRHLPRFDVETAPSLIPNVTVGRIANRLDLMGPSYTIDAACASSLLAVDIAIKGLRHGEYDLALVGGMQVATPVPVLSLFCRLKALSLTGSIRPFDKDADGTLLSEGLGVAVLKRRADAERDGDRIYAFVKSTGAASDGRAVSVLAPRVEGEELALRRAYEGGGIPPQTVGLVEAHGTATLVGDAVEVEALGRVFGGRHGPPRCALGSVKSMIGHTLPAAGMAGFIKAALSLYHKVLPPTLGVTEPSPRLKLERTPFYVNTETRPWIHGATTHARRAGVNAFGFGGINAHVVLEEAPASDDYQAHDGVWETELCLFAGRTRAEVAAAAREVVRAVQKVPELKLADVAFTLASRWTATRARDVVLSIVASSVDDLQGKVERALARMADPSCVKIKDVAGIYFFGEQLAAQGTLAFVFPGEGAQYVNMLGDLCRHFPEVRACFDEMDRHFIDDPRNYVLSDLVFPPPSFSDADRQQAERRLFDMDAAVEAIYTANHAVHTLLTGLGITPAGMLGHSTGEYSAMRAANMFDDRGYQTRVRELNRIYHGATADGRLPGQARLIAVGSSRERVERACAPFGDRVRVAMDNCRHQVVVVASPAVAGAVEEVLKTEGFLYEILAFDRPYHTPAFAEYAQGLKAFLQESIAQPPSVPLYSATSAARFPADLAGIQELAYEHWLRPVEFRRTIEQMYADGFRIFVEAGPRGNLTAFVDDILGGRAYAAIPANTSRRSGVTQLHHLLAHLAAHGTPLTLAPLYRTRRPSTIDMTHPVDPGAPARILGRVKIPTGTPQMGLSPDVASWLRARMQSGGTAAQRAPVQAARAVEVPTAALPAPPAEGAAVHEHVYAGAPSTQTDPGAASLSTQVMSAFMGTMDRFLTLQQDLIGPMLAGPLAPPIDELGNPAFIHEIVSHQPGDELVARCSVGLDRYPCLRDHTLGRDVSAEDPALEGFPLVPFTLMTEIMAEAATLLAPGGVLTGMRQVRVNRWVALDRGPATFEVRAQMTGPAEVAVRLLERDGVSVAPVAEGVMVFAAAYAAPPMAEPLELPDAQPYDLPPERLYKEAMFHGPSFQGVLSIDRVGHMGAHSSVAVLDRSRLIAQDLPSSLVTDFVLLDMPGQVLGFWASQFIEQGFLVLPFQLESLTLYGPPLPPGERLTCLVRISVFGEERIRASFDLVHADGRIWARFDGWEDRRFDVPPIILNLLLTPEIVALAQPWPGLPMGPGLERFVTRRLGTDMFPPGWLSAHGHLWTRVLAANILNRAERERWHAMQAPHGRRTEWLLGRIAAKDAVREYVRLNHGLDLSPADVELTPDEHGRPIVYGAWTRHLRRTPLVSITHVNGVAVAIAGEDEQVLGIGVDLERLGRMRPATARVAFTERELAMIESVDAADREAWSLRFWCAKEACAKATGKGLGSPHAFLVQTMNRETGAVSVTWDASNHTIDFLAMTAQDGDWLAATCAAVTEGTRR